MLVLCIWGAAPRLAEGAEARSGHGPYQELCSRCHPTAGDFASDHLIIKEGILITRRRKQEVLDFLLDHRGGVTEAEATHLRAMLRRHVVSGSFFQKHCRICHERASSMARRKLIVKNGELFGRYTDRRLKTFLSVHGRSNDAEGEQLYDILKRHAPRLN